MENLLTQIEADALIAMEKKKASDLEFDFPDPRIKKDIPLVSKDGRERFRLTLYRGRIELRKVTYQTMGRVTEVLLRLDIDGTPHSNPDGEILLGAHLHIYREGAGHQWAIPVPDALAQNLHDPFMALEDFMKYSNIIEPPIIQRGLFA